MENNIFNTNYKLTLGLANTKTKEKQNVEYKKKQNHE